jgi:GT2 family glycosyltransferase
MSTTKPVKSLLSNNACDKTSLQLPTLTNMHPNEFLASVIVIVKDDLRVVRCVDSLLAQTLERDKWELLVVDNSTGHDVHCSLQEKTDHPDFIYVKENAIGMGYARNAGIYKARGQYVAFIDADCMADKRWLEQLLMPFANPGVGGVGGKIVKPKPTGIWDEASRDLVIGQQEDTQFLPMYNAPYVVTANAAFPRKLLLEVGGFDTQLPSGMDVDICWQICIRGYDVVTAPQAIVEHDNRESLSDVFRQFTRYGIGHAGLFHKYRKITGRKFLINTYPAQQLCRLFIVDLPILLTKPWRGKAQYLSWMLRVTENIGLIYGDVCGAFRYRVPYL